MDLVLVVRVQTSAEMKAVRSELGEITYSTKTRGERKIEAARPAGRGFYGIIRHGYHTTPRHTTPHQSPLGN